MLLALAGALVFLLQLALLDDLAELEFGVARLRDLEVV
jgi:hypothetical protein